MKHFQNGCILQLMVIQKLLPVPGMPCCCSATWHALEQAATWQAAQQAVTPGPLFYRVLPCTLLCRSLQACLYWHADLNSTSSCLSLMLFYNCYPASCSKAPTREMFFKLLNWRAALRAPIWTLFNSCLPTLNTATLHTSLRTPIWHVPQQSLSF